MRYLVALAVAGILVGGISLWACLGREAMRQRIHRHLLAEQAAGHIPPEVDLSSGEVRDVGLELPDSEKFQLGLLDAWFGLRVILIPMILVACLTTAHYWPSR